MSIKKTPSTAVKIFWLWEVEVKVRLNTEDSPIQNLTFAVPSPYSWDAKKIAHWMARKKGTIRISTEPKCIDVAFGYYPNRTNKPEISQEQKQLIWDMFEDGIITPGDCVWIH